MLGLPTHLHAADTGTAIILLDTRADRYQRIVGETAALLRAVLQGAATSDEALLPLMNAGLLTEECQPRALASPAPSSASLSALEFDGAPEHSGDLVAIALALLAARARLRNLGLARTLSHARRRAGQKQRSGPVEDAVTAARQFDTARGLLPMARRCLPDALALHSLLIGKALGCRFVIGVRDAPFAAHAWVERDAFILSDPIDTIRELTPILRI